MRRKRLEIADLFHLCVYLGVPSPSSTRTHTHRHQRVSLRPSLCSRQHRLSQDNGTSHTLSKERGAWSCHVEAAMWKLPFSTTKAVLLFLSHWTRSEAAGRLRCICLVQTSPSAVPGCRQMHTMCSGPEKRHLVSRKHCQLAGH